MNLKLLILFIILLIVALLSVAVSSPALAVNGFGHPATRLSPGSPALAVNGFGHPATRLSPGSTALAVSGFGHPVTRVSRASMPGPLSGGQPAISPEAPLPLSGGQPAISPEAPLPSDSLHKPSADSVKIVELPYRPVLLVIRVENQNGATLNPANLLSVLDSSLERSFNVNRLRNGLIKVHLPRPGLYKLLLSEEGFKSYASWLRIGKVKSDSILVGLVQGSGSGGETPATGMHQASLGKGHFNASPDLKDVNWLNAYPSNFTLILVVVIVVLGMIMLSKDLKKIMIRLNKEVQQGIYKTAAVNYAKKVGKTRVFSLQGEVMVTAGPRKKPESGKNNDLDLGEDVCGLAIAKDTAWFWLLDGTSDQASVVSATDSKELFSSRLLAQSLAVELKELLPAQVVFPDMLYQSIEKIRQQWLDRMAGLTEDEAVNLAGQIILHNPICSSTLLIGTLNTDGLCTAYRSGDSKMLVFGADAPASIMNPLKDHPGALNDRLFFRMTFTEQRGFDIEYNKPKIETHIFHGIDKMLAYSDGVGNELQDYLNAHTEQFSAESRRLLPYLRNMTSDDKSLCILERVEEKTQLN